MDKCGDIVSIIVISQLSTESDDIMDLRQKWKIEQENLKKQRKDEVIATALQVFKIHGIENTKTTDTAEIEIASLYRYFKTKPYLAVEASYNIWE